MSTCEVRLFVPKGYFTAYVSGMTVVDEIFCSPLYSILFLLQIILVDSNLAPNRRMCAFKNHGKNRDSFSKH
jgi:hypothetical protein